MCFEDLKKLSDSELWRLDNLPTNLKYCCSWEEKNTVTKDNTFDYYINEYAFRDQVKNLEHTKKIGFFGCSVTFGLGLDSNNIFPTLVEQHLGKNFESINLGVTGASVVRIARILSKSLKLFNFSTVIITLPPYERFSITSPDGSLVDIHPSGNSYTAAHTAFYRGFNNNTRHALFCDNISWMIAEIENAGVTALWSSWDDATYDVLTKKIDNDNLLPMFNRHTRVMARDGLHPGPEAHLQFSDVIVKRIK